MEINVEGKRGKWRLEKIRIDRIENDTKIIDVNKEESEGTKRYIYVGQDLWLSWEQEAN